MLSKHLPQRYIEICVATQTLDVIENETVLHSYAISTAKNGIGQQSGSECTPAGWHKICAKIGAEQAINSVFVGRRVTGEIYTTELAAQYPKRDWILSRILWLAGQEAGFNRYGTVDSARRYIYIHGCPEHLLQGQPASHGCIRMNNSDAIALFEQVNPAESVFIHDFSLLPPYNS